MDRELGQGIGETKQYTVSSKVNLNGVLFGV